MYHTSQRKKRRHTCTHICIDLTACTHMYRSHRSSPTTSDANPSPTHEKPNQEMAIDFICVASESANVSKKDFLRNYQLIKSSTHQVLNSSTHQLISCSGLFRHTHKKTLTMRYKKRDTAVGKRTITHNFALQVLVLLDAIKNKQYRHQWKKKKRSRTAPKPEKEK